MKIEWIGHSCFLVTAASGRQLVTDPYDISAYPDQLFYQPVSATADVVTLSHAHGDHGNAAAVSGDPVVITTPGVHEVEGFTIRGVPTFHDGEQGSSRGENVVFVIGVDGLSLCHLGDLGHELQPEQVREIGPVDVLLLPVGGTFTIDAAAAGRVQRQLEAAVTIPMHFRNRQCSFPIDGVDVFLEGKDGVERPGTSFVELTQENFPAGPKIIVLEPAA